MESQEPRHDPPDRPARIGFLCLTRSVGEGVMIGENIHVIVNRVKGGQVRLAVYAPKDVRIQRSTMADPARSRG